MNIRYILGCAGTILYIIHISIASSCNSTSCFDSPYCAPFGNPCDVVLDNLSDQNGSAIWISNAIANKMWIYTIQNRVSVTTCTCNVSSFHCSERNNDLLHIEIEQLYIQSSDSYAITVSLVRFDTSIVTTASTMTTSGSTYIKGYTTVSHVIFNGKIADIASQEADITLDSSGCVPSVYVMTGCPWGGQRKASAIVLSVFWLIAFIGFGCVSPAMTNNSDTQHKLIGVAICSVLGCIGSIIIISSMKRCSLIGWFPTATIYVLPVIGGGVVWGVAVLVMFVCVASVVSNMPSRRESA